MCDSVLKRVAIRKYTTEQVKQKELEQLIAAFQAAPCGMHQVQDMAMTVVTDPNVLKEIEDLTDNACYQAPVLFVIKVKKASEFGQRDASAAAENIMIEAASLNLGSVYLMNAALKVNSAANLRRKLAVKEDQEISVIVACGHSAEKPQEDRTNRYQVTII